MPPLHFPHEATALINELSEPIPPPERAQFVRRVLALLAGAEILSPGAIVEASKQIQIEMRIAPESAEPPVVRPSRSQTPRSPFRRRG
jgi:hypothetical protein